MNDLSTYAAHVVLASQSANTSLRAIVNLAPSAHWHMYFQMGGG